MGRDVEAEVFDRIRYPAPADGRGVFGEDDYLRQGDYFRVGGVGVEEVFLSGGEFGEVGEEVGEVVVFFSSPGDFVVVGGAGGDRFLDKKIKQLIYRVWRSG